MNSLPNIIEYLLLNHDYVVVPGMGTFIAQQTAAQRNDEEEAFLPPVRSLRFNAGLNHEDHLLPDSISAIYNTTTEQAEQMLAVWVTEFLQSLEDETELEFGTLGVFTSEGNGNLIFTSQESGIASPDFYGLDAFHMCEVSPEHKAQVVPLAATMETSEKEITIRINRRIANVFVAACAAVLLFLVFNNPMPNADAAEQRSSLRELFMGKLKKDPALAVETPKDEVVEPKTIQVVKHVTVYTTAAPNIPQPTAVEPEKQVTVVNAPAAEKATASAPEQTSAHKSEPAATAKVTAVPVVPKAPAVAEPVQQTSQYCIVMASAISKRNADNYAATLRQQGYNNPRVMTSNNMVRVVVGNYGTESEAYQVAETMRRSSEEFGSVWVLKL